MTIREDLVASAVTFLQDPSVAASPVENRIAFLQSKNLTQEEVDTAMARAGGETASTPTNYSNYAPQQQMMRQPSQGYGGYQQNPWQQPPPPEVPKRDWRDWFIMATVMGGVGYGAYFLAKRYVYPLIAPPTPPQIEQDKAEIDASFEKAFALLDQLSKDTETLKTSEEARTERLDTALSEVESVIGELKGASRRREEESRRINDEVRGLKELIPKAMAGQQETTDNRLKELNTELKSLKTLMGQRMNPASNAASNSTAPYYPRTSSVNATSGSSTPNPTANGHTSNPSTLPNGAIMDGTGNIIRPTPGKYPTSDQVTPTHQANQARPSSSSFHTGAPPAKAAIPAWQMAAASKSSSSVPTTITNDTGANEKQTS